MGGFVSFLTVAAGGNFAAMETPAPIRLKDALELLESGAPVSVRFVTCDRRRGTGMLNNELYLGRLIWNRLRYVKDPDTGKRVSRPNPESEWLIREVPELRIVGDALWQAVKDKQTVLEERSPAFWGKRRAPNLFSFLLKCGECGWVAPPK